MRYLACTLRARHECVWMTPLCWACSSSFLKGRWSMSATSVTVHVLFIFFFQAEDGIRDDLVTGVQTCALPISLGVLGYYTFVQSDLNLFGKKAELDVYFAQTNGLREGDSVLVAGMRWGKVKSLEIGRASCRERV